MLIFLLGGLFFTVYTKGIFVRNFFYILSYTFKSMFKTNNKKGISSFAAINTALAGTMGTGNIVGVATAIYFGGAGSLFWMWISAFLSMALKYFEIFLSVRYSKESNGSPFGGPMYYLKETRIKLLPVLFCIFAVISSFSIGNIVQANSISSSLFQGFNIPKIITGIAVCVLTLLVVLNGIKSISDFAQTLVPFMTIAYMIVSLFVIFSNYQLIIPAFKNIITSAFSLKSVNGGIFGSLFFNGLYYGVNRGIFSNEAGMGSAPIAYAASSDKDPVRNGFLGIFEVFLDTIVTCTLTGLVILTSDIKNLNGAALTQAAYAKSLGNFANIFIGVCIAIFAFCSIITWCYYGEQCLLYLSKGKYLNAYKIIFCILIILGSVLNLESVWKISDITNLLMALPNLIGLFILKKIVKTETLSHLESVKKLSFFKGVKNQLCQNPNQRSGNHRRKQ